MNRALLIFLLLLLVASCAHMSSPVLSGQDEYIITIPLEGNVTGPHALGSTRVYLASQWAIPPEARAVTNRLRREFGFVIIDTWPLPSINEFCVVVQFQNDALMSRIERDDQVLSVQKINQFAAMRATPIYNDARLHAQLGDNVGDLNRLHAWSTGKNVRVAIIDTPIDLRHPDLRSQIAGQTIFYSGEPSPQDFVHGTAIAGIIGAAANNGIGVVGYAPDAALRSYAACHYRASSRQSVCNTFSLAKAIAAATHDGADVVNLSLAGPDDRLLARLIHALQRAGSIIVASDNHADEHARFPANLPGVIAAGTLGTSQAARPNLISVEDEHLTTRNGGSYQFFYGSSMSAARVTALASLLLEQRPGLTGDAIQRALSDVRQNCRPGHQNAECRMKFALDTNADVSAQTSLR